MDFILVEPVSTRADRARRPPIIFQHGGGQKMSNYIGEAAVLAKAGAVSLILEAPYRSSAHESKRAPNGASLPENSVHIIIGIRRALDWLGNRDDIDLNRIAYVGHSYGGNAGAVLAAVEKRIKVFALIGLVASYSKHVAENRAEYWNKYRSAVSRDELAEALALLRPTDPEHYLPKSAPAPLLFQCARFDSKRQSNCMVEGVRPAR